jgi:hypothetical protein
MGDLLLELLPSAIGLALTPTAIVACVLFLSSSRPLLNSLAFAAPFAICYSLLAALVLGASELSSDPLIGSETKHIITLVIGLFLLGGGLRSILVNRPARATGWVSRIATAGPGEAFVLGTAVAVLNPNVPILIAGLAVVAAAPVSTVDRLVGVLFLLLAAEAGLIGPIAWYALMPGSAQTGLATLRDWLVAHQRQLNQAVLLVFGLVFTIKGFAGL